MNHPNIQKSVNSEIDLKSYSACRFIQKSSASASFIAFLESKPDNLLPPLVLKSFVQSFQPIDSSLQKLKGATVMFNTNLDYESKVYSVISSDIIQSGRTPFVTSSPCQFGTVWRIPKSEWDDLYIEYQKRKSPFAVAAPAAFIYNDANFRRELMIKILESGDYKTNIDKIRFLFNPVVFTRAFAEYVDVRVTTICMVASSGKTLFDLIQYFNGHDPKSIAWPLYEGKMYHALNSPIESNNCRKNIYAEILFQSTFTLHAFSQLGIVHHDLHLANIFVDVVPLEIQNTKANVMLFFVDNIGLFVMNPKVWISIFDYDLAYAASLGPNPYLNNYLESMYNSNVQNDLTDLHYFLAGMRREMAQNTRFWTSDFDTSLDRIRSKLGLENDQMNNQIYNPLFNDIEYTTPFKKGNACYQYEIDHQNKGGLDPKQVESNRVYLSGKACDYAIAKSKGINHESVMAAVVQSTIFSKQQFLDRLLNVSEYNKIVLLPFEHIIDVFQSVNNDDNLRIDHVKHEIVFHSNKSNRMSFPFFEVGNYKVERLVAMEPVVADKFDLSERKSIRTLAQFLTGRSSNEHEGMTIKIPVKFAACQAAAIEKGKDLTSITFNERFRSNVVASQIGLPDSVIVGQCEISFKSPIELVQKQLDVMMSFGQNKLQRSGRKSSKLARKKPSNRQRRRSSSKSSSSKAKPSRSRSRTQSLTQSLT